MTREQLLIENENMTVTYTEDFKRDVLRLFNDDSKIKHMLETNNPWVGRYLDDGHPEFTASEILKALDSQKETEVLKNKCMRALEFRRLYDEYWKIRKD